MENNIIKVQDLGKKYRIRHDGQRSYQTLREALPNALHSLLHPLKNAREAAEDFWALKDVSFEVKRGECVGIIGRNGAGKSTLLKLLSRITEPTTGQIELRGRVGSLLEVGTGFHAELTGRENIYLNGTILGMKKKEIDRKFDEIVAFAQIEKFLDTPVKRYSSGMYVRLAFAVAAHLEPEILIVDEVLAVGDVQFQKKCLEKMSGIAAKDGITVLFVSHNMAAIQSLCSRACLLETGQLVQTGRSDEVVAGYFNMVFQSSGNRNLVGHKDRVGSGLVRLLEFDVIDSNGRSMEDVPCGKDFRMEINFQVTTDKVDNLRFGISFFDNSGRYITEFCSYYGSEKSFSCQRGTYKFIFASNKMPLSPGQFNINFIITSGLEVLDWIKDTCKLTVSDGLYYKSGQMPLPGSYPVFFTDFECELIRK